MRMTVSLNAKITGIEVFLDNKLMKKNTYTNAKKCILELAG